MSSSRVDDVNKPKISVDDFSVAALGSAGGECLSPGKPVYRSNSSTDIPPLEGAECTSPRLKQCDDSLLNPLMNARSTSCPSITDAQLEPSRSSLAPLSGLTSKTSMLSLVVQAPETSSLDEEDTSASRDSISDNQQAAKNFVKSQTGSHQLFMAAPLATIETFDDNNHYEKCLRWLQDLPADSEPPDLSTD